MKVDFKTLKELHEHYAVYNTCKLKSVATQPVYDINPPKLGIVFIGEAPGKNEDLQGKPFVGSAGKLLDDLLNKTGFKREDVYISNVVKYRPPSNRDPVDSEKKACRVWLNAELMFIKPKVIIPLGKHALERFVPGEKISLAHGKAFPHPSGTPIFAMYHPAVGLYNPNLKDTLLEDFKKLKEFLDGGCKVEPIKNKPTKKEDLVISENAYFDKEKTKLVNDIISL